MVNADITIPEAIAQGFSPYAVGGRTRIFNYDGAGIPIPGSVTEVYRRGEELLTFSLPMTAAEQEEILDCPVRRSDGSLRDITYREYLCGKSNRNRKLRVAKMDHEKKTVTFEYE